jgi:signal transduction histidine kinase
MLIEDLRGVYLFDGLSDEQLRDLLAVGDEVRFESGDVLFHEGEAADFWWVLLAGRVELEPSRASSRRLPRSARSRQAWLTSSTTRRRPPCAAGALQDTCDALLSSLARLADQSLSAEQFIAMNTLRQELGAGSASMSPVALADREEALADWLETHRVTAAWDIAPALAAAGADIGWCERAGQILDGGTLEPGLEWVTSTLSAAVLLSEVKQATERVSGLVAAMKSYTQLDRAPLQFIDVTEGIDSTLVMLRQRLQDGITVICDYGTGVPQAEGRPAELNQVWTNIIDNAIDAMGGKGTLRISTRADPEHVLIEIADTGPGMPADVQARAFDAFYTTKDVGKGTGLGLDIARRIVVERHHGQITIDSRPGETVLRVELPLRSNHE